MTSAAYYNEIDQGAAAWLRELIKAGDIAPGEVDTRSITDVQPDDLRGFTQCHFFAGIGGWSLALRMAGWDDARPVWTGSCPCQPFSVAGKGKGTEDERHLWPELYRLIAKCRPAAIFGEQVAGKAGVAWLGAVRADLEASRYAVGAADLCAAGVGAPHIRQRLYWTAYAAGAGPQGGAQGRKRPAAQQPAAQRGGEAGGLVNGFGSWGEGRAAVGHRQAAEPDCDPVRLADAEHGRGGREAAPTDHIGPAPERPADQCGGRGGASVRPGDAADGFWSAADWLACRDGKWRPAEPGTFPLVAGLPGRVVPSSRAGMEIDTAATAEARVMRLRGYGNAINPILAAEFIGASTEAWSDA